MKPMKAVIHHLIIAAILGCRIAQSAGAPPQATITPLGYLPNVGIYTQSHGYGVSADGSTVVGWSYGLNAQEAFRWTRADGMVGLGSLPGSWNSSAYGVSADGSTVVGISASGSGSQAFRWTRATGMVGLGNLPGGEFMSHATAVSADGRTVIGYGSSTMANEAFRWTTAAGMVGLGALPGDGYSIAHGVSADGNTVVGTSGGREAFRWTTAAGLVGLGTVSPGSYSGAIGVSADGRIVVGESIFASGDQYRQAFCWTSADGMIGLGDLPGGMFSSMATGVSLEGTVIGTAESTLGATAFVWRENTGMQLLYDVVLAHGVDPADDGWSTLTLATAISPDGRYLAGTGVRNGLETAFLINFGAVPEPRHCVAATVLSLVAFALGRKLRCRKRASVCHGSPPALFGRD